MYQVSKSGNVYKDGVKIPLDDSTQEWQDFKIYRNTGGEIQEIEFTTEELTEKVDREVEQLKLLQKRELAVTDWAVVRKYELGTEIPEDIQCKREDIRNRYNSLIAALTPDINQQYK